MELTCAQTIARDYGTFLSATATSTATTSWALKLQLPKPAAPTRSILWLVRSTSLSHHCVSKAAARPESLVRTASSTTVRIPPLATLMIWTRQNTEHKITHPNVHCTRARIRILVARRRVYYVYGSRTSCPQSIPIINPVPKHFALTHPLDYH